MEEDGLYDYVIVNDELDKAFEELTLIAERALAGDIGAAPEHVQALLARHPRRDSLAQVALDASGHQPHTQDAVCHSVVSGQRHADGVAVLSRSMLYVVQAQNEAEAERNAEEAGASGAAVVESDAVGGDGHDAGEEEEALLQRSSPGESSAPQGLERWRGKVALVTGPRRGQQRQSDRRARVMLLQVF